MQAHFFRFPLRDLALPDAVVRKVSARTFDASEPLAGLVASYLPRVAVSPELRDLAVADSLAQPTVELVRAALLAGAGEDRRTRDALEPTLAARILEHVRRHLGDPDLGPAGIAAEHHISVRHLYGVLAAADVSLGKWIRSARLEACRRDLAATAGAEGRTTIAAVARRWGFVDASHFSRVFRQEYGMSPRQWRELRARR
ncbi:helix-turn-helix domain-containing protein [Cellulomonas marina]|uniref:AraC-type DNA-binding protein n=1 Tax=Cellulomonas marina TaxID=988821 RepID=A0A1I0Z1Q0_9CELL|nr:helix-turn-helix domain-containing protein [Cellulomonas marina]GIG28182.1 hypothetical protein Cma02nite_07820 [Cellulomonas marina]SFB19545.1 AraC-type DNA-binding protein [Cellulomonas marina]